MKTKRRKNYGSTYPYDFYCYKDDSDVCPECGSKPRDYRVPSSHIAVNPPVIFECAFGHKWQENKIKDKV